MKKSTLYTLILGGLAATSSVALVGAASAADRSRALELAENDAENTIALSDLSGAGDLFSGSFKTLSTPTKDETVFLIADSAGTFNRAFIGNNIYTGSKSVPVELRVKYYLDGAEISANALKGQSGHVKIEFSYASLATYQGQTVPFVAATGAMLDTTKFSNLSVTNGKIAMNGDNYVILGYGLPGLNANFNTDLIPESFAIEADTTDFALDTTYTVFTTSILADLDTSKLTSVDAIINSVNDLGDGIARILDGAGDLSSGLQTLVEKTTELAAGISQIEEGLNVLASKNEAIMYGAGATFDGLLAQASNTLNENAALGLAISLLGEDYGLSYPITLTRENYNAEFDKLMAFSEGLSAEMIRDAAGFANSEELTVFVARLKQLLAEHPEFVETLTELGFDPRFDLNSTLDNIQSLLSNTDRVQTLISSSLTEELAAGRSSLNAFSDFYNGLSAYTNGVAAAANGVSTLSSKMPTLINGETELYRGSVTLKDGISTFKTSGIDKLVDFANEDASSFLYNTRKSVDAARSYHNFANPAAETVKFIVKTASVK